MVSKTMFTVFPLTAKEKWEADLMEKRLLSSRSVEKRFGVKPSPYARQDKHRNTRIAPVYERKA